MAFRHVLFSSAAQVEICGTPELDTVHTIELIVDTSQTSLGKFGQHLPSLEVLKLSNSSVPSIRFVSLMTAAILNAIRDLGTSLSHITVLWLMRCGLADVDGLGSMPRLQVRMTLRAGCTV